MRPLTCLSCAHHRPERCVKGMPHWPEERLDWCVLAQYAPGADEREDWDEADMAEGAEQEPRSGAGAVATHENAPNPRERLTGPHTRLQGHPARAA